MRRFRRFRGLRGLRVGLPGGLPRVRLPRLGWVKLPLLLIIMSGIGIRIADSLVLEPLAAVAETEARLRAVDAINQIVIGTVGKSLRAQELITFEKDGEGRIAAYHVNTQLVNEVATEAAIVVHEQVQKLTSNAFGVPIGTLSGSKILASAGPHIPVKMIPVGSVLIDVKQGFEAAGINQTRHRIWLRATATVQVVVPLITKEVTITADLPVTETVIVGPVPTYYGQGNSLGGVTLPVNP